MFKTKAEKLTLKSLKKVLLLILLLGIMVTLNTGEVWAMHHNKDKKAIVIACFGTTYPQALIDILDIEKSVKKAFPNWEVRLAFTSNIIRHIWHKRRGNPKYSHIPKEIIDVKGPLATIADLQDEGYKIIIVQPTHLYAGEEFHDLCSYVDSLNHIKTIKPKYMPFKKLVVGRPIMGMPGPQHDYHKDLEALAKALKGDVEFARKNHAALVYMGHGNEFYSTGVYIELQEVMRKMYPDTKIFVGTVEGFPSLDDVIKGLVHWRVKRVVLKPLMIVAGDHARNDMAGNSKDSWKNRIEAEGIEVIPVIKGLGENPHIREIIIQHIKDAAKDNGIKL